MPIASVWLIGAALLMGAYVDPPHAVTIDLPPLGPDVPPGPLTPLYDKLYISPSGKLLWNGEPIDEGGLRTLVRQKQSLPRETALVFEPDGSAPYDVAARTLGILEQENATGHCFIFGNTAQFRAYDRPATFDGLQPASSRECRVPYGY